MPAGSDSLILREILLDSRNRLTAAQVDSPSLSAQIIAAHVLGVQRVDILVHQERRLVPSEAEAIRTLVDRRAAGEPVAYILGRKEFYGHEFAVEPGVLVPRPETEHIVEWAESNLDTGSSLTIADLGTGSGILAVTLALLFPGSRVVAVDVSRKALGVARRNARGHHVANRVEFVRADFGTPLRPGVFDVVVSNPPYLTPGDLRRCSREVAVFEPRNALIAGTTGMECIQAVLGHAAEALCPGGVLLMEVGQGQDVLAKEMAAKDGRWISMDVIHDLAGIGRTIVARSCY
ncbi:MAG: peptide chain release factor N(5)-glutamine methyltransferase [Desulfovibrionales bacterium]